MADDKLLYRELTYKIIGLCYKIHTALGCGFPEKVYHRALKKELTKAHLSYSTEKEFPVKYDSEEVGRFRLDLIVDNKVIVELKALERLPKVSREQLISQLKAAPYEVGLLINFGAPKLEYHRIARAKSV